MITPRRNRRPLILIAVFLVLAASAVGGYVLVRKYNARQRYAAMREEGMAAHRAGDHSTAIARLGTYWRRHEADADVLYCLAESRLAVEVDSGRHVTEALHLYRRFLTLRPQRLDVLRKTMELYARVGHNTEAVDAATKLLEAVPGDPEAVRIKADGLAGLQRETEAIALLENAVKSGPLDVEMQLLLVRLYAKAGRANNAVTHALALLEKQANDGRVELIAGAACLRADTVPADRLARLRELVRARQPSAAVDTADIRNIGLLLVLSASQRSVDDLPFARSMVEELSGLRFPGWLRVAGVAFPSLRLPGVALPILQQAVVKHNDAELRAILVVRLFEAGLMAELEKLTAGQPVKLEGEGFQTAVFRCIALARLGQRDQARGIVDALSRRKENKVALAWAAVIGELLVDSPDAQKIVEAILAVESPRRNSHLQAFLGDAYLSLGEREAARRAYEQAARFAPLWPWPLMQLSRLLVEQRQPKEALDHARQAARLMPGVATFSNLANVWGSNLDAAKLHEDAGLVQLVADVQRQAPGEPQTLPLHVTILAQSGKKDEAVAAARALLDPKARPAEGILLRLAGISRRLGLGVEAECESRCEELYGLTPQLALARALRLAEAGKAAEGLALLDEREQREQRDPVPWRLARVEYMERTADPRAADAVRSLADDAALKADLRVQRMALAAASVQRDHAFIARTIDRVRAITGDRAVGWRMAKARLLVRADAAKAELEEGAKLLEELLRASGEDADVRQLLGSVYQRLGNTQGAVEQFAVALKLKPESATTMLNLALLYHSQGETARAREQLGRIKAEGLGDEQRRQLVVLLVENGQPGGALAVLEQHATMNTPADQLTLARLYQQQNLPVKAEPIYRELLKQPTVPAIASAARFYAAAGRMDEAAQVLQRLDALEMPAVDGHLIRAEFYASTGDAGKSIECARAATAAAPGHAGAWRMLIAQLARSGRTNEALDAMVAGAKAVPDDKLLASIVQRGDTVKLLLPGPPMVPLVLATLEPALADVAWDAMGVVEASIREKLSAQAAAEKLRPIADRAPRFIPLQVLLMQWLLAGGQLNEAQAVAQRTMAAAPASPEAVQAAAQVSAAAGNWSQVLALGRNWRELTLENPLPADLLIAEAHLRAGRLAEAAKQIDPYLSAAVAKPEAHLPVLRQHARILIGGGQATKAASLLWPSAQRLPDYRRLWIELAMAMTDAPETAAGWLERLAAIIPASAANEQMDLANAWHALGERMGDAGVRKKATAWLAQFAQAPDAPVNIVFTQAFLAAADGEYAQAEALYRRLLTVSPDHALAQNNLAMVLLDGKGDLKEAAALAAKAVKNQPEMAAYHDSLALILAAQKDWPAAIAAAERAVALEPQSPKWLLTLAAVRWDGGQADAAAQALSLFTQRFPDEKRLPDDVRGRLSKLRLRMQGRVGR